MPLRSLRKVFRMSMVSANWIPLVKVMVPRLGKPDHLRELTRDRRGKLTVERIWSSFKAKVSSMTSRFDAERDVICETLLTTRLPVMRLMPERSMGSTVPVATAMLPEKVVQPDRPVASPRF